MSLIHYYFICFSIFSLALGIIFFNKKKGKKLANILMGVLLLLYAIYLVESVIWWLSRSNSFITGMFLIVLSLIGPLFYVYSKININNYKIKYKDLLHLIPFLIVVVSFHPLYISPVIEKGDVLRDFYKGSYGFVFEYMDIYLTFFILNYAIKSILLIKNIDTEDNDLKAWLRIITFSFLAITIGLFLYELLYHTTLLTQSQDFFISFLMTFFVSIVGYFAFIQPDVFNGKPINKVFPVPFVKYKKAGLSEFYSLELKKKLLEALSEKQLFLKNDLGLTDLAEYLNVSRNHASQVINENFKVSFYDLVNEYRIKEAQKLLLKDNTLSFSEVAHMVGFNNRISFYNYFKKITGSNPTEYMNNLKSSKDISFEVKK